MALIVVIQNMSNAAPVSDYAVEVRINREVLGEAIVTGHRRADGWLALLARVVETLQAQPHHRDGT